MIDIHDTQTQKSHTYTNTDLQCMMDVYIHQMIPKDPYFMRRKAAEDKVALKVPNDQRQKFLSFNRKVLRFYCLWDDRNSIYGERRPFILHFYLEDDSVEVVEVYMFFVNSKSRNSKSVIPADSQYNFRKKERLLRITVLALISVSH